jgi:hypothetical protein
MFHSEISNQTWQSWGTDLNIALMVTLWIISIIHAFRVRKEYLVRLMAVQQRSQINESRLKEQMATEYQNKGQAVPTPDKEIPRLADKPTTDSVQDTPDKPSKREVDVPVISLPYEDLFEVCAKYEADRYFVGEAIGQKRLTIAHDRFPIPTTEHVVALIDTSVLGTGKIGLALCEGGVYWKNSLGSQTDKTFLPWTEFASVPITFRESWLDKGVELGKGNLLYLTQYDIKFEDLSNLLSEVQLLAKTHIGKHQRAIDVKQDSQESVDERRSVVPPERKKRTSPHRKVRTAPPSPEGESASAAVSRQVMRPSNSTEPVTPRVLSGDELEYEISSSYPFPIAFGFRSLMSIVDYRDLYREQLRIAENLLAFLASVSLAMLQEQDRPIADIDLKEYWRSGISPGDWKDIIGRCSKVFATYDDNPLALEISRLNIRSEKKGFGRDIAELIRTKNDYKHDRGPTTLEDIAEGAQVVQERLRRCMGALAFFSDYPIRQVEDFNVSRSGDEFILKCLRYMGDHPSFPQEEVVLHRGFRRGDLFLDLDGRNWVPLYPFILPMTCSHCKARETYFIDLWDPRRGTARMKSFERGHTMNNAEVAEALARWAG